MSDKNSNSNVTSVKSAGNPVTGKVGLSMREANNSQGIKGLQAAARTKLVLANAKKAADVSMDAGMKIAARRAAAIKKNG